MKRVACVFGTRPEAIKMAPVLRAFREAEGHGSGLELRTCLTGQHRDLVRGILELFDVRADYDLDIMSPGQSLGDITRNVLQGLDPLLDDWKPDLVLVHGDTTTSFAAAVAAFYRRIPVGHVEAGLRTHDPMSPYPEEFNRRTIATLASLHFAPTSQAVDNLLVEGCSAASIHRTGNTGIDALLYAADLPSREDPILGRIGSRPFALLTAHRRENFGAPLRRILEGTRAYFLRHPEIHCVYPVHPNPQVRGPATELLGDLSNVHLVDPVGYGEMARLLKRCRLVLTDSGGLQEEAPALGKPLLVLRESTERPEVVASGQALLVGSNSWLIDDSLERLLAPGSLEYARMSRADSPFGDGKASARVVEGVRRFLGTDEPGKGYREAAS